jgi:ribosomal protein S18 acetylase RimI-like enzyme
MISELQIRKATPDDSKTAVKLIHAALGRFGDGALGFDDHAFTSQILTGFFELPRNRFSHEVSWLAEMDGHVVGILVAFPGSDYWRRELVMAGQVFRVYGFYKALRLFFRSIALAIGKETEKDELYISDLATDPQYRRQGVGKRLLSHAEHLMKNAKLSKCSLIVELDNLSAQALYSKMGFKIIQKVETPQYEKKFHTRGYYRMVKVFE